MLGNYICGEHVSPIVCPCKTDVSIDMGLWLNGLQLSLAFGIGTTFDVFQSEGNDPDLMDGLNFFFSVMGRYALQFLLTSLQSYHQGQERGGEGREGERGERRGGEEEERRGEGRGGEEEGRR